MNHPYLLIAGATLLGGLLPYFLVAISQGNLRIPRFMIFVSMAAAGLLTAAFVLR